MVLERKTHQFELEEFDNWRLCAELSIVQAALLLAGRSPSVDHGYVEGWEIHKRPEGYEAAKAAISNALRKGAIEGTVVPMYYPDNLGGVGGPIDGSLDFEESRVEVDSLRTWLAGRGLRTGFFFPAVTDAPEYMDPNNPRYARKLAAAVRAWQAVTDPKGKAPKQALMKWLREHAAEFGLSDEEGKPNETGIEEVAKVANWQIGGGAPKTPSQ
jgi:hypothetical protein